MNNFVLFLQNNRIAILLICLAGALFFGLKSFRGIHNDIKHASKTKLYIQRFHLMTVKAYARVMRAVSKIPVIGDIVGNISYSYRCHEALTEEDAALRTGKTLLISLITFVAAFIFGVKWFGDIIISMITSVMLAHIALTALRSKPQKFLTGLQDATEDFLLAYHKSSGNIDEAFHEVSKTKNPVARHFDTMHKYIKRAYVSQNPNAIQNEYNAIAPSRFLRNIYAIIYMAYKFGDQKDEEGRSALNNNLMEVQEQVGDALYQQNKLLSESMGERWFIILPIYAIPLLSWYMLEYFSFEGFEFINTFINSSTGYMVSVLCAGISLICYLMYARMAERGILEEKISSDWAQKALRYDFVRRSMNKLLPKNSPKRKTMATMLKRAGRSESVDAMQVKRIFIAITLLIIAIFSSGINYWQNASTLKNDIYTGLAKPNYEKIILTQNDDDVYIQEMLDADWNIVQHFHKDKSYNAMSEDDQRTAIKAYMKSSGLIGEYRGYESYGITRIQSKIDRQQGSAGLNMILFIIIMGAVGYFMPYVLVYLQSQMNSDMLLLDETNDLQKMAIMLMGYSQTTPESLLEWYASSSILLAPQLRECTVTHDFNTMIESTNYKPFIQVATCLQMAFSGLPLKEAFSGVEQRLLTQRKEHTRIMESMLKIRIDAIERLTSISMGAVIALYMFMPLLVAMVQMFMSLDVFS